MEQYNQATTSDVGELMARFTPAVERVQQLARDERYAAAIIFGSVAFGTYSDQSDLDVMVVSTDENLCANINHPNIDGVKLDLTFTSLAQLREMTEEHIRKGTRRPMIAGARIVFDKTGELAVLLTEANAARPKPITPDEHQFIQFVFFHMNDKIERFLDSEPAIALVSMHMNLGEALDWHYRLQGQWRVSSKWLLIDLRRWDLAMADLVERFVTTGELRPKFTLWSAIVDLTLVPLRGRQPITENNCRCAACARDLATLLAK